VGNLAIHPKMETKTSMMKTDAAPRKYSGHCFLCSERTHPARREKKQFAVAKQDAPVLAFGPPCFDD
jgi:hypothetical protein